MDIQEKKAFAESRVCKIYFWLLPLLLALLCAVRAAEIFENGLAAVIVPAPALLLRHFLSGKSAEERLKLFVPVLALCCTCGLSLHMPSQEKSLIWLVIWSLLTFFLPFALRKGSGRSVRTASAVLGGVFAFIILLGTQLKLYDRLELLYTRNWSDISWALFCMCGEAFFLSVALNMLFSCIIERAEPAETGKFRPGKMALYMALILLCWLPYYYAFYPGTLSPDSFNEISQQLGLLPQSSNHPYLHQLLIGACLRLGGGELERGVGIYTTVQMLLLSLSMAACVEYLESRGVKKAVYLGALCFFALFPVNAFYSVTMWKNVLHGAAALMLMLLLTVQSERRFEGRAATGISALTVLTGFFFCTLLNNAWYALLLGLPVYILCNRKSRKRLSVVFLLIILLVSAYNRLVFDALGVKPSTTGEVLSVPLQQIARVADQRPEELESEEFQVLGEVFYDIGGLGDRYISYISDPVKAADSFNAQAFDSDPARYMKCWLCLGLRNPVSYVEAFLLQNYGYWYPDVDYWIVHNSIDDEAGLGLAHREDRLGMGFELSMLTRDLSKTSPLSVAFSLGLMTWLLVAAAVLLTLKGHAALASPMLILAMIWLGTLASPVFCEYRYMYAPVLCVPLFLGLALGTENKNL